MHRLVRTVRCALWVHDAIEDQGEVAVALSEEGYEGDRAPDAHPNERLAPDPGVGTVGGLLARLVYRQ